MNEQKRRTCLIVGASRGIGLGIARHLDASGYHLALTARSADSEHKLRRELDGFQSRGHLSVSCDVVDERQIQAMFARVDGVLGPLDALVVNAGIHLQESAMSVHSETWDHLFAVDVRGAMLCCQQAARRMVGRGGAIVVVGSIAAERPVAGRACYCAAKAAVHMYTQSAALEWAPMNIRINVVAPGPIDTEFISDSVKSLDGMQNLEKLIPIGRVGNTEDVAHAVNFLLSDSASYITGSVLRVDGGRLWS